MNLIAEEVRSILDEIAGERLEYLDQAREFTVQMLADHAGITHKQAESMLAKQVASGKLEMVMRINPENNHRVRAYRKL